MLYLNYCYKLILYFKLLWMMKDFNYLLLLYIHALLIIINLWRSLLLIKVILWLMCVFRGVRKVFVIIDIRLNAVWHLRLSIINILSIFLDVCVILNIKILCFHLLNMILQIFLLRLKSLNFQFKILKLMIVGMVFSRKSDRLIL